MSVGNRIASKRSELRLTLDELGQKVGVTKSTVNKWERGETASIKVDKFVKLAKALEVSVDWLLDGYDNSIELTDDDKDLLGVFKGLSRRDQIKLMSYAYQLEKEGES